MHKSVNTFGDTRHGQDLTYIPGERWPVYQAQGGCVRLLHMTCRGTR